MPTSIAGDDRDASVYMPTYHKRGDMRQEKCPRPSWFALVMPTLFPTTPVQGGPARRTCSQQQEFRLLKSLSPDCLLQGCPDHQRFLLQSQSHKNGGFHGPVLYFSNSSPRTSLVVPSVITMNTVAMRCLCHLLEKSLFRKALCLC